MSHPMRNEKLIEGRSALLGAERLSRCGRNPAEKALAQSGDYTMSLRPLSARTATLV